MSNLCFYVIANCYRSINDLIYNVLRDSPSLANRALLIKQILSSVMPYALAGGAIYIGLLFAPSIITQIMAPKRA